MSSNSASTAVFYNQRDSERVSNVSQRVDRREQCQRVLLPLHQGRNYGKTLVRKVVSWVVNRPAELCQDVGSTSSLEWVV